MNQPAESRAPEMAPQSEPEASCEPTRLPSEAVDTGLSCLVGLALLHERAANAEQIRHRAGKGNAPFTARDIVLAARSLDLKSRLTKTSWSRLVSTPLPAIAELTDGRFVVLAKAAEDKVLIQDPREQRVSIQPKETFLETWSGRLILVTRRAGLGESFRKFNLAWFIPAILRYKHLFSEVLIASFFLQIFALVTPLFFQVVIDKVLVHRGLTTLDVLVFGLIVVSVFEILLTGLRTYLFSHTTNRIDVELGAKLFGHLLALPMSYFQVRRVGDSVARVRELETIRNFLTSSALTVVIDLFFTVVFLVVMYHFSPTLTYIVLAAIPFYVALSVGFTPVFRRRLEEKFRRGAENQAFLVESVTGVETLKAMAVEPQMQRRWEEQLAGYVATSFQAGVLSNVMQQGAGLINKLTIALTLWFGAQLVIEGSLTIGQLVAFNMLAARVSQPVLRLAQLWQDFQQARISIDRLGDILNTHAEPAFNPSRAALPAIRGDVSFDHVSFRYRLDGPEVLSDVSLEVPAGQILGIVGSSGSGKSTLTKLVQRLHVPERGRVLIDGVDLAVVDTTWLRRQVGVVLQENVLFNRTVRENIALTDSALPMERVIAAAKLAGAHDFILQLPEGYDTQIGERGSTLSGGQRQRIAIARALVGNPR
ncbi:MAG: type I secretion system permease/ATPase, partial [Kiloniellales bacterium]|nr:type I secretion system permease/ATPase [Kiloniellales bacterium]